MESGASLINPGVAILPLALRPEAIPTLQAWFEREWPEYYGPDGPGDARQDLEDFACLDRLPVGFVAYKGGELCGTAALKAESIPSHRHLAPWAAAGLVAPQHRRQGIGAQLLAAVEHQARSMGFPAVYCATATSESLLRRCGWELLERARVGEEDLGVYRKTLLD